MAYQTEDHTIKPKKKKKLFLFKQTKYFILKLLKLRITAAIYFITFFINTKNTPHSGYKDSEVSQQKYSRKIS